MRALSDWLVLARIPVALAAVALAFTAYARFAMDSNLQNLKASLTVLDRASGIGQAEAALLLVDQTLVAEMAKAETNLRDLSALQYAQGTLSGEQRQRPVSDTQAMVAVIAEDRSSSRNTLLSSIDSVVTGLQTALQQAALLPRAVVGGATSDEVDREALSQAGRLERLGMFQEAIAAYEKLIAEHPRYSGRPTLKLRLGYLYQRNQIPQRAAQLYREAAGETRALQEAQTAGRMLAGLAQSEKIAWKAKELEQRIVVLSKGAELQQLAFELGSLQIQLYQIEKAARTFRKAIQADPNGSLALAALFKEGWCLRTMGRFDEAFDRFQEVIRRDPKGRWGAAAYQQIAEAYRATGDYAGAIQAYETLLKEIQDQASLAIAHAQAGSTLKYDLKQSERAAAYLEALPNYFPASPFSNMQQQLQRNEAAPAASAAEGRAPAAAGREQAAGESAGPGTAVEQLPVDIESSLVAGSPLMGWIERFLPIFVDVFCERLSRYMEVTGEKELTRRFTEQEFRELVVRRVRERFPNQISELDTKIRKDGFVGTGSVRLGILTFNLEAVVGIKLVNDKPFAKIESIRVGMLQVPEALRQMLEARVNTAIDRAQYPLKIKRYELYDGYVLVSVEQTTKKGRGPTPGDQVLF